MNPPNQSAEQPLLPLFFPTVQVPQGDGSVLVKPGRPVEWMTPKEFGRHVGLGPDAIYRKLGSEAIPQEFVRYSGPRKIQIRTDAIPHFLAHYRDRRLGV